MELDKYSLKSIELVKAIDIAIDSLRKHPPKIWNHEIVSDTINIYEEWKENALKPLPQYRNLKSLSYSISDTLTYFQESSGDDVNYFWDKIKEQNLPYKRENKLAKILKRKKIKDDIEFDFVIDVLVPYQQEGLINEEEVILLNTYLGDFEQRSKKK